MPSLSIIYKYLIKYRYGIPIKYFKIDFTEIALPDGIIDLSILTESNETKGDDDAPEVDTKETPDSVRGGCTNWESINLYVATAPTPKYYASLWAAQKPI